MHHVVLDTNGIAGGSSGISLECVQATRFAVDVLHPVPNAPRGPSSVCLDSVCGTVCVCARLCGRGNLVPAAGAKGSVCITTHAVTGHEANFVCLCLDHAINEAGLFCHLGCVCELPGGGRPFCSCWPVRCLLWLLQGSSSSEL